MPVEVAEEVAMNRRTLTSVTAAAIAVLALLAGVRPLGLTMPRG